MNAPSIIRIGQTVEILSGLTMGFTAARIKAVVKSADFANKRAVVLHNGRTDSVPFGDLDFSDAIEQPGNLPFQPESRPLAPLHRRCSP